MKRKTPQAFPEVPDYPFYLLLLTFGASRRPMVPDLVDFRYAAFWLPHDILQPIRDAMVELQGA
jgi:hypothetical protein